MPGMEVGDQLIVEMYRARKKLAETTFNNSPQFEGDLDGDTSDAIDSGKPAREACAIAVKQMVDKAWLETYESGGTEISEAIHIIRVVVEMLGDAARQAGIRPSMGRDIIGTGTSMQNALIELAATVHMREYGEVPTLDTMDTYVQHAFQPVTQALTNINATAALQIENEIGFHVEHRRFKQTDYRQYSVNSDPWVLRMHEGHTVLDIQEEYATRILRLLQTGEIPVNNNYFGCLGMQLRVPTKTDAKAPLAFHYYLEKQYELVKKYWYPTLTQRTTEK